MQGWAWKAKKHWLMCSNLHQVHVGPGLGLKTHYFQSAYLSPGLQTGIGTIHAGKKQKYPQSLHDTDQT